MPDMTWDATTWARIEDLARTERENRAWAQRLVPGTLQHRNAVVAANHAAAALRALAFTAGDTWRSPESRRR